MLKRKLKSEKQKEQDKKGAERMRRFEENQFIEIPEVSTTIVSDEGMAVMVVYQKIDSGEWKRVEIPYKKKGSS